jgi:hypothetical protein
MSRPELRVITGQVDPVVRRRKFEEEHPEAVILPPSAGQWRAVASGRMFGSDDLGGLMDQLDEAYPEPG